MTRINHAERFSEFCEALDKASENLRVKSLINKAINATISIEGGYKFSTLKDQDEFGNCRMTIPKAIIDQINSDKVIELPKKAKKPVTWFICWLNAIHPDKTKTGWESYQCSHLCTRGNCITETCLCWESASSNQSRGNDFCERLCAHKNCKKTICKCQGLHDPPCAKH